MEKDLKFNCYLEDDDRNIISFEWCMGCLSIDVKHMVYPFWLRVKYAFRLLFKGWEDVDICITEKEVEMLQDWLDMNQDWLKQREKKEK